ncbi:MAG: S1 RNA-binding domain-containing protein [Acidimicrobiales bacterium]|nr:S1 RNA-binding domain-containing protein [Acidimicrobiales bacterium]
MKISHVIVDGSNIATEGRDAPSLAQLDEAVQAFIEEYTPDFVTVVVDATFPNRIDRKERQTYEDAVNANELITPPAGAIGRGDAFILQIARRAGAAILSNDSFQEFHGEYPWLFEKGRLIGGKPVPHVGWVFMDRAPVRGPTSRRAVSEARKMARTADRAPARTVDADGDGAKAPRKRRSRTKVTTTPTGTSVDASSTTDVASVAAAAAELSDDGRSGGAGRSGKGPDPYNEALPFIDFVAQHPVGSEVDAVIEKFSSHGAYVMVGEARGYLPLRNLADPPPRSAKEVLRVGDEGRFVVVAVDPPRRGIDLAVPGVVAVPPPAAGAADGDDASVSGPAAEAAVAAEVTARREATKKAAASKRGGARRQPASAAAEADTTGETPVVATGTPTSETPEPVKAPRKRAAARKKAPAQQADIRGGTAEEAPTQAAAEKAPTQAASEAAQPVAPAEVAPPVAKTSGTRKAAARKAPAKRASAKKAPAKKAAKKAPAKKAAGGAKKAPAKKAAAARSGAAKKKAPAKKTAAKKSAASGAAPPAAADDAPF